MTASIVPILLLLLACSVEESEAGAAENVAQWVYDIYPGVDDIAYTLSCRVRPSGMEATCAVKVADLDKVHRLACSTRPGDGCALLADCPNDED